jgi:hypothetical protein
MTRKSGNRFSEKVMLKKESAPKIFENGEGS